MYPIHHTFGPHATLPFALRSLCLIFQPWKWRNGSEQESLRNALQQSFGGDVFLFYTAREALAALLRAIHLRSGEEVIIQAFTCVVVPNAVHACGGVPIYADVDGDTLNLDCADVERKITPRTRAIIAQHTFGIPADLTCLRKICDERGIFLIEDCAQVLPDDPSSPLARTGDFAILSFGRDKAISGVSGGAVISQKADAAVALADAERNAGQLPFSVVFRFLLYPLIYRKARALYVIGLGRAYLALCKKLRLLIPIVTPEEKQGNMILRLRKLPNACAALALYSMQQLPRINAHRRNLTQYYIDACGRNGWNVIPGIQIANCKSPIANHPLQKFPLFFPNADGLRASLKEDNIFLDDGWTGCVICPRGTDTEALEYTAGADPEAEQVCEKILCLPTHPTMTMQQAQRLILCLAKRHDH
ncbi:MAG: putative PLP-dependent enzyme [Candidatus Peregrinibacteria bacterium Greene1014_49]|nr:MAG: putative PLP-dependent enzyme [Candidatus Peregrinibacteria bacterium Greene1014_49]